MSRSSVERPPLPAFDWRRLRGLLAENCLHVTDYAKAGEMNYAYTVRALRGEPVGAEGRLRFAAACVRLNLPAEAIVACGLPQDLTDLLSYLAERLPPGTWQAVRDAS